MITIIITSSYIKTHPSIAIIRETILSLNLLKFNKKSSINNEDIQIIIAQDGLKITQNKNKYYKYIDKLKQFINDNKINNIEIKLKEINGCYSGNIRNILQFIKYKYLLIIQHDMPFIKDINLNTIIEDMTNNNKLKNIRFNRKKNEILESCLCTLKKKNKNKKYLCRCACDRVCRCDNNKYKNIFGSVIKENNYYICTPGWSDNNNLYKTDFFVNKIMKEIPDNTFPEDYRPNGDVLLCLNPKAHLNYSDYGMVIYGNLGDTPVIKHTDGRNST